MTPEISALLASERGAVSHLPKEAQAEHLRWFRIQMGIPIINNKNKIAKQHKTVFKNNKINGDWESKEFRAAYQRQRRAKLSEEKLNEMRRESAARSFIYYHENRIAALMYAQIKRLAEGDRIRAAERARQPKRNESKKDWSRRNPALVRSYRRRYYLRNSVTIVAKGSFRDAGLPVKDIPAELLKLKCMHILVKRQLKKG